MGDSPLEGYLWPIAATPLVHKQRAGHAWECMTSWGDLGFVVPGHISVMF